MGASTLSKGWVSLYFGYLASTGSVTRLHNFGIPGYTTADLRRVQLPRALSVIDGSHDTVRVTINIGFNDRCESANAPACPIGGNLRAILTTLNAALARDPGDESIQIMEMFNPYVGLAGEGAYRAYLLGHIAFLFRTTGRVFRRRTVGAIVLLALVPAAVVIPALAALALVSGVCSLVAAYEALRYRADRVRVRHPELAA